jgi:hypothetical protein
MPEQSMALLTLMGSGYRPLAGGVEHHRPMPFEGVPGLGSGPGAMAAMAFSPQLLRMYGAGGTMPLGSATTRTSTTG